MKKTKYIIIAIVLIALFLAGRYYFYPRMIEAKKNKTEVTNKVPVKEELIIKEVQDGNTIIMSDGKKVRLLGVDAPEKFETENLENQVKYKQRDKESIMKLGVISYDYLKKAAEGKKVKLESDPNYYDVDQIGRNLRYVYLEDGTFLNEKIISEGYANVFYDKRISKNEELFKIEQAAKKNKTGLWGEPDGLK